VTGGQLHVSTHVDVVPVKVDEGTDLLVEFMAESRHRPGLVHSALLRQAARKNHFELLWVWRSQADYERHLGNPATRQFRARLKPLLGSPIQDRLLLPVDLAAASPVQ
jgi:quinol monooxygenase YgiN